MNGFGPIVKTTRWVATIQALQEFERKQIPGAESLDLAKYLPSKTTPSGASGSE